MVTSGTSSAVRRPKLLMAGAVLLLLLGAFTLPVVQGLAQEFLSIFRVKSIQPVTAPPRGLAPPVRPQDFVNVTVEQKGQVRSFASVAEARAAGFSLRTPGQLPAGVLANPQVSVKEGSQARVTVDRQKAEAALAAAGVAGVTLDPRLDGAEFRVQVPAVVLLSYGDRVTVAQGPGPEVLGPPGLDYDKLRTQALAVLGAYAPDTAAQLAAIGDWRSTLPLPLSPSTPRRSVTVDGVEGLVIEGGEQSSGNTAVIWQKHGSVYGVWGAATAADLLATANSLR